MALDAKLMALTKLLEDRWDRDNPAEDDDEMNDPAAFDALVSRFNESDEA